MDELMGALWTTSQLAMASHTAAPIKDRHDLGTLTLESKERADLELGFRLASNLLRDLGLMTVPLWASDTSTVK